MSASTLLAAPLVIAGVLALSGLAKIADQRSDPDSGSGIRALRDLHVPDALVRDWVVTAHPIAEVLIALGLILLPTPWRWVAAAAAVALMAAYTVLVVAAVRRSRKVTCNCFGRRREVVSRRTVARNLALLVLALAALADCVEPAAPIVRAFGGLEPLAGTAILAVSSVIGWLIGREYAAPAAAADEPNSVGTAVTSAGRTTAPENAEGTAGIEGAESAGFERAPIPDESLVAADGTVHSLTELVAQRAVLLLIVDPACGSCVRALGELPGWQKVMPEITLIPVRIDDSYAGAEARARFSARATATGGTVGTVGTFGPVGTVGAVGAGPDRAWPTDPGEPFADHPGGYWGAVSLAGSFETRGATPWAVLLGADGLIAGGPTVGYPDVRAFLAEVLAHLAGLA